MMKIEMEIKNDGVLTREEGFELTKFYVEYYWATGKFYSLKNQYELEDLVHEVYAKFLEKKLFEKYNSSITSKKYHVMNSVRTSLIDMLRKYREHISLDKEDELGITLAERIEDVEDVAANAIGSMGRDRIINSIPKETDSKLVGDSPLFGTVNFSLHTIAVHLEQGYSVEDISKMFINPRSGKPVTKGRVQQMVQTLREYVLDNIPIYG